MLSSRAPRRRLPNRPCYAEVLDSILADRESGLNCGCAERVDPTYQELLVRSSLLTRGLVGTRVGPSMSYLNLFSLPFISEKSSAIYDLTVSLTLYASKKFSETEKREISSNMRKQYEYMMENL
ncbi:unnamed protein product [Cuscuta campestris]|uniref:Uncharacterized protein n=1 Tax=Cuscuta campestris TaxID=132261 RepID=A0A484N2Y7_9ASTE|nr:unnamed protein product [Cuscuta campestris]